MKNTKKSEGNKKEENKGNEDEIVDKSQFPPALESEKTSFFKKIRELYLEIKRLNLNRNNTSMKYASGDEFKIFEDWLPIYIDKTEIDLHYGGYHAELKKYALLRQGVESGELDDVSAFEHRVMKFYEFFKGDWPLRISDKFYRKYREQPPEMRIGIACYMSQFSRGVFGPNSVSIEHSTPQFLQFFSTQLPNSRTMIWMVGVERLPTLDRNNKVMKYSYTQYVHFLDIATEKDLKKLGVSKIVSDLLEQLLRDPDRGDLSAELQILQGSSRTRRTSGYNTLPQLFVEKQTLGSVPIFALNEGGQKEGGYSTFEFRDRYLSPKEASMLNWNEELSRWVPSSEEEFRAQQKLNQYAANLNASLLRSVMDLESAKQLVELLEKIPNFKIRMTQEEKNVVGQNGNVLALGRSGTGKTTCALLRLFASEILFKLRLTQAKINSGELLRDSRFSAEDVDNTIGLHTVFVTASPILTNEVERYYRRLTDQIKEELRKRRQKLIEKKQQELSKGSENKGKDSQISENSEMKLAEEQIKDITINAEEEPEDNDLKLIDQEEEAHRLDKYTVLTNIEEKEFPLFLTVRKLIMMVDGTLKKPFFARDSNNKLIQADSNAEWSSDVNGVLLVNNYRNRFYTDIDDLDEDYEDPQEDLVLEYEDAEELEEQYRREVEVNARRKQKLASNKNTGSSKRFCFEVDYNTFATDFWTQYTRKHMYYQGLSAHLVWSEITSTIKGGADSHKYAGFYLPSEVYMEKDNLKKSLLTKEKKEEVYKAFSAYEAWKTQQGAYDFQDVVNYILVQIKTWGYVGQPIHYLMIDEVQDLSHATLMLLARITEQSLFFAGDTAQTIASGVGFKFSDLAYLFNKQLSPYSHICKPPAIHQLTVNFRSHARILELANSVVNVIELFFPKTIDKLKKEKSTVDGPKPIVLDDANIELLFLLLFGAENYRQQKLEASQNKSPIEFGCNQVIIVKDQESKEKVPQLLKHALCLTVFEAKGLEFDDVILYNFFSDSKNSTSWGLVNSLEIKEVELNQIEFDKLYFVCNEERHGNSDDEDSPTKTKKKEAAKEGEEEATSQEEQKENPDDAGSDARGQDSTNIFGFNYNKETGIYKLKRIVNSSRDYSNLNILTHGALCNELKQLYVSITRPRKRLIIYDDDIKTRQALVDYWKKLDLVETYSSSVLQKYLSGEETLDSNAFTKDLSRIKAILTSSTKDEWKKQGVRMFNNKYYEQAMKCFERCDDKSLYNRAKAYALAEQATRQKSEIAAEQLYMSEGLFGYKEMSATALGQKKIELQNRTNAYKKTFREAGELFLDLGIIRQASQCFFSAEEYETAANLFEQAKLNKQAGEAYFMIKNYKKAAEHFSLGKVYTRAIDCYAEVQDYPKILEIVEQCEDISQEDKAEYAAKFVPLALKAILNELEMREGGIEEGLEGLEEEEKAEGDVSKIKEVDEENNEDSVQEDRKSNKNIEDMSFSVVGDDRKSESPEILKKDIQEISFDQSSTKKKNIDEMSFSEIQSATSAKDRTPARIEGFEHLSEFDPEDGWLQLEEGTIVDAVSQLRREDSKRFTDYSSLEYNYVMSNNQCQLVKTKIDIFAQDSLMTKIIKVITIFSAEARSLLAKQRSKNILLSEQAQKEGEITMDKNVPEIVDMIIDFDQIDMKFIFLILDLLEHYKLYKLCIFVCNRYKLAHRVGRYLVSIAHKYSDISKENSLASSALIFSKFQLQIHSEKAFVANMAVHSVLENINPKFLSLKKDGEVADETNSLGFQCYREMILLGYWKKCLFIMDINSSLALASSFASFTNYKLLYLQNYNHKDLIPRLEKEDFEFLPFKDLPENPRDATLVYIALDAVVWDLSEKYPLFLNRFYKDSIKNKQNLDTITVPEFPSYFAFNGVLWNFLLNRSKMENPAEFFEKYFNDAVSNLLKILNDPKFKSAHIDFRIYDIVSFIILVLLYAEDVPAISSILLSLEPAKALDLVTVLCKLATTLLNSCEINKYTQTITRALLLPFRMRVIEDTELLSPLSSSFMTCHISSPIFARLVSPAKTEATPANAYMCDIEYKFALVETSAAVHLVQKEILTLAANQIGKRYGATKFDATNHHWIATNPSETTKNVMQSLALIGMIDIHTRTTNIVDNKPLDQALAEIEQQQLELKLKKLVSTEEQHLDLEDEKENEGYTHFLDKNRKKVAEVTKKLNEYDQKSTMFRKQRREILANLESQINYCPYRHQGAIPSQLKDVALAVSTYPTGEVTSDLFMKTFSLLKATSNDLQLTEIIRANGANDVVVKFSLLNDSFAYLNTGCTEEFCQNFFEFFSKKRKAFAKQEQAFLLAKAASIILIGSNLYSGNDLHFSKLFVGACELLNQMKLAGDKVNLKTTINPLPSEDMTYELFYWIDLLADDEPKFLFEVFLNSLVNANIEMLTKEIIEVINSIMKKFKKKSIACPSLFNPGEFENVGYSKFEKFIKNFRGLSLAEKNKYLNYQESEANGFIAIKLDPKEQSEENLDNSERLWLKDQALIAKRITAERCIAKAYRKRKPNISKFIIRSAGLNLVAANVIKTDVQKAELLSIFKKNSATLQTAKENLSQITQLQESVMKLYAVSRVHDALDYHYLASHLTNIAVQQKQLNKQVERVLKKDLSEEIGKDAIRKEVNSLKEEFEAWRSFTEKKFVAKEKKKGNMYAARWEEKYKPTKMSLLAKKRAAIRKQELLKLKAEYLKAAKK